MQPTTPTDDQPASSRAPATPERVEHRSGGLIVVSYLFRALIALAIVAFAGGVVKVLIATKVVPARTDEELALIRVRTIESQRLPVERTWDGYGTARSMNDADVVAEVGGRVIERPASVEVGKKVSVGTVLMRLDSGDYLNTLNAANQAASAIEAQLDGLSVESERVATQISYANDEIDAVQRDLDRTQQAIDAGAGSAGELDAKTASVRRIQREVESLKEKLEMIPSRRAQLLAQLAAQRANAATAQENLDRSTIRSPISGVIQSVNARRGDWVALGTPVARVVDLARLEIPVRLPASAVSWIGLGDEIQLWEGEPTGDPDQIGVITRIAPEADASSRTITVYAEVEQDANDADLLSPGRFVLGRVHSPDDQPRFVVPRRAVQGGRVMLAQEQNDGTFRIEVRPVTTAYSIEGHIESIDPNEDQWTVVSSGIQNGDHVVVSLLDQISHGMIVEVLGTERRDAQSEEPVEKQREQPSGEEP